MIIFYNKQTGVITGTIAGRVHPDSHLNMWIGDHSNTERIICNWKPVRFYREDGSEIPTGTNEKAYAADFEPDHEQKDIFAELDRVPSSYLKYKVGVETKKLIKI